MPLHRFHGGLRLPAQKIAALTPIRPCPLPTQLVLPLRQHAGTGAICCVSIGQAVRRGEMIGHAADGISAAVHASSSGRVVAIEDRPVPHASGLTAPCVVIDVDGHDQTLRLPALDQDAAPTDLLRRLAECGIVGLGGAAFPSAAKLAEARATLILNAAECEPYIACDDGLLREHADGVIAGAQWLQKTCAATRTLIAVEDRMREAGKSLAEALERCGDAQLSLIRVPTIYPEGGERQLIRVLTGREVPSGGLPRDIQVICHNVATAYAAWRAIEYGEALTSRIVSVSGRGVATPGNFEVRLGTPIEFLIEQAGGYRDDAERLVMGGPMMGIALPHDGFPVIKACNSVLVLAANDVRASAAEMPCIRCGECVRVCPAQLMPQQLFDAVRLADWPMTTQLALNDCIECGCCAAVCPSQIPLVDWYRHGKSEIAMARQRHEQADAARNRFYARNTRLGDEQARRVARVSAGRSVETAPEIANEAVTAAPAMDKSAVLAAIARGRARKRAQAGTDDSAARNSGDEP